MHLTSKLSFHVCLSDESAFPVEMRNLFDKHNTYILLHGHKPCVVYNCCQFSNSDHILCIGMFEYLNELGCVPGDCFFV